MNGTLRRSTLQALTFMRKEVADALRQPRLLVTLVLGPFLIMAAFGLGYRNSTTPLRTIFVISDDNPMKPQLDKYTEQLRSYVQFEGTTPDPAVANELLADGDIDVVVTFPADPMTDIAGGNQSKITIVHTRLDPVERTAISFASELAVNQINAGVLAAFIGAGQQAAQPFNDVLAVTDQSLQQLRAALQSGDADTVNAALDDLDAASASITQHAGQVSALVAQIAGQGTDPRSQQLADQARQLSDQLASVHARGDQIDAATVDQLSQTVNTIRTNVGQLAGVDPQVLAQPFTPEVLLAVPETDRITDWYAPAAIVLILQQFGLAFGAMTFVRERQLGITDVLRIAPIGALPAVIGKYLAYLLLGGAMGAVLTVLAVGVLDIPIAGSIGAVAAVMALTLFASIGLGLFLSLLCRTDAQAVQYSLLVLLASLFFSGFFLSLDQLGDAARAIAWLLPVTYGMRMLRDVMLRGTDPDWRELAYLTAYGVVLFGLTLFGAHRRMVATVS
jgi:ABC-2 type transport system permease protein